jgi:hypothetical protein
LNFSQSLRRIGGKRAYQGCTDSQDVKYDYPG